MNKNKFRVLLTAAGGPGGAGIIHALKSHPKRDIEVIAGVVDNIENGSLVIADDCLEIPYANDIDFKEKMLKVCLENHIDMIIPGFSEECLLLASCEKIFQKNNINILIPNSEVIELCHHKVKLMERLNHSDLDCIMNFELANNIMELKNACNKLGYPKKTLCVKPAICNGGSRGFYILKEDYDRYKSFFIEKDSRFCTLEELILKLDRIDKLPMLIVMEYIDGDEYGIDLTAKDGNVIDMIIRRKLKPTMAGIDMRLQVIEDNLINKFIIRLTRVLNLNSILSVDLIKKGNKIFIIEINPRQGASIGAGVIKSNLLAMAIDIKLNNFKSVCDYQTVCDNLMSIRYINEFTICDGKVIKYKHGEFKKQKDTSDYTG